MENDFKFTQEKKHIKLHCSLSQTSVDTLLEIEQFLM